LHYIAEILHETPLLSTILIFEMKTHLLFSLFLPCRNLRPISVFTRFFVFSSKSLRDRDERTDGRARTVLRPIRTARGHPIRAVRDLVAPASNQTHRAFTHSATARVTWQQVSAAA